MHQPTILLAQDYEDDIALLQRAFHKADVGHLQVVRNGDEAMAYLEGRGRYADRHAYPVPSLVLMDMKMPRRSGLEVLRWIREQDQLRPLPVVVLAASPNVEEVERAHALGANSCLVKPTSFHDLVQLIRAFVGYWLQATQLPVLA